MMTAPPMDDISAEAAGWNAKAEAAADWMMSRLVVRYDVFGGYTPDNKQVTIHAPLTRDVVLAHCRGERVIGFHTTSTDNKAKAVGVDIDAHSDEDDPEANWRDALVVVRKAREFGLRAYIFDSNGVGGFHVRVFFRKPIPVEVAYWLCGRLREGLSSEHEVFPKQDAVTLSTPFGNWMRAPGRHHKRDHWTRIYEPGGNAWHRGEAAADFLVGIAGDRTADLMKAYEKAAKEADPGPGARTSGSANGRARGDHTKADSATVQEALDWLRDSWARDYGGSRGNPYWLGVGMALHDWDPTAGLDMWCYFSARCPEKYNRAACEAKWSTFTQGGGLTLGTIFKEAEARGWEPPWKRAKARRSAGGPSDNGPPPPEPEPAQPRPIEFNFTDTGNAERFAHRHGARLRHCHMWRKFLVWDDRRWVIDTRGVASRMAKETARSIYADAAQAEDDERRKAIVKWATASESAKARAAMLQLVCSELPIDPDQLDRDAWSLNCPNGTLDLRAGRLRKHDRGDLLTKLCPVEYHPDAECPVWIATLDRIFDCNDKLRDFWQRLCGLCLTGDVSEQILPIPYGKGANGKSTALGTMLELLGQDYAMKAMPDLLMAKRSEGHPTDRADLFGKRLVVAIETAEGARLNETLVKELTGSDNIRARRMREDPWEFSPTHKVILSTNHKPVVRGTDHAIWRRIKLIPFMVTIPDQDQDKALPQKLRRELPGILAWAVRGCLEWQRNGLGTPEEVAKATAAYRQEEDDLGTFLAENCVILPDVRVKASALYARYRAFTEGSEGSTLSQKRFGAAMTERGFERTTSNGTWYLGLGLRQDSEHAAESDAA